MLMPQEVEASTYSLRSMGSPQGINRWVMPVRERVHRHHERSERRDLGGKRRVKGLLWKVQMKLDKEGRQL
jgi:hypothetical protein